MATGFLRKVNTLEFFFVREKKMVEMLKAPMQKIVFTAGPLACRQPLRNLGIMYKIIEKLLLQ